HAAVLERERRVLPLVLHEEARQAELAAELARGVEARSALRLADDLVDVEVGEHVLAVAPDAARLPRTRRRRRRRRPAAVEDGAPRRAREPERAEVGDDLEERAAARALRRG